MFIYVQKSLKVENRPKCCIQVVGGQVCFYVKFLLFYLQRKETVNQYKSQGEKDSSFYKHAQTHIENFYFIYYVFKFEEVTR